MARPCCQQHHSGQIMWGSCKELSLQQQGGTCRVSHKQQEHCLVRSNECAQWRTHRLVLASPRSYVPLPCRCSKAKVVISRNAYECHDQQESIAPNKQQQQESCDSRLAVKIVIRTGIYIHCNSSFYLDVYRSQELNG